MKRRSLSLIAAGMFALGALAGPRAFAYDFIDDVPPWPDGNVTLELQLITSNTYSDGTTPNGTAIKALEMWNPSMQRVQLTYVSESKASQLMTNGKNNVFFSPNVYGSAFGDGVLAVTVGRITSSGPIEMDVVVNSAESWDSYRGSLNFRKTDLRRVLAHEFGHVLGLDHPDEAGQWVTALMNAYVSAIDAPAQDDKDGASARYGRGPGNLEAPAITEHPESTSATEGATVIFWSSASGSEPLSYQWFKDGGEINGATSHYLELKELRLGDAGTYMVRVSNEAGSVTSNEAVLTVEAATLPVFTQQPPESLSLEEGASLSISAWATSNVEVIYQWTRDGVPIPAATDTHLLIPNISAAEAGTYRLTAANPAGTTSSIDCVVTVLPPRPPSFFRHPSSGHARVGNSFAFDCGVSSITSVTFQWTHDGVPIPGATGQSLTLQVTAVDGGMYQVTATNMAGSTISNPAVLTIDPLFPPAFVSLSNVAVTAGSPFSLWSGYSVEDDTNTYQWYRDGVAIPGATSSNYEVSSANMAHTGEYFVIASNAAGSTASSTARVKVIDQIIIPAGGWKQSLVESGVVYFLFENPSRIERFDLASEAWLAPLELSNIPGTIACAPPSSVIVTYGRSMAKIDTATGAESLLATLDFTPDEIRVHGDRVFILTVPLPFYRQFGCMTMSGTTAPVWTNLYADSGTGFAIDETYGRAVLPLSWGAGIRSYLVNEDGSLGTSIDSPITSERTPSPIAYLRPDGTTVLCRSGIAYASHDLAVLSRVDDGIDAVTFIGTDTTLVLRGSRISIYAADFSEIGNLTLSENAQQIASFGDNIYAFTQPTIESGATIHWQKRSLSERVAPPLCAAVRPSTLEYAPDDVMIDRDGVVLIYSRLHGNIFRWSTAEQRYLDSILLHGRPNSVSYSSDLHRIYTGYADGRVRMVDLNTSVDELEFLRAGLSSATVCTAGNYLLVQYPDGESDSDSLTVYDSAGRFVDSGYAHNFSRHSTWDRSRRRVYYVRSNPQPVEVHYSGIGDDGSIAAQRSSNYFDFGSLEAPLRISPNGDVVIAGSGRLLNTDTLAESYALPHAIVDAAWLDQRLFTIRQTLQGSAVERWSGPGYALDGSCELGGSGMRLLACGDSRLQAVTKQSGGRLAFTLLDADLNIRNHFEDTPDLTKVALANLSTRGGVEGGDGVMIAGFVVGGAQNKRLLVRGIGPTMGDFGIQDPLPDAVLTLMRDGESLSQNDNWQDTDEAALRQAFTDSGAFELPDGSKDSAIIANLAPGAYTAVLSSKDSSQGVGMVEVYDLAPDAATDRLVNISTRAVVGVGERVLIPGLVISGSEPKRLIIRAVGPGMASTFGLAGVLEDPQLHVIDLKGNVVLNNDDWGKDNPDVTKVATEAAGGFELTEGSKDAALVATLDPGVYTVIVSGVGDTAGLALVEVYEVP